MNVSRVAFVAIVGISIAASASPAQQSRRAFVADSIVLERSRCFGACPEYRVRLAQDGRVAFASRNPGDITTGRGSVPKQHYLALMAVAASARFEALPDTIANKPTLCGSRATDHPTATVAIYWRGMSKRVVDYYGCFANENHDIAAPVRELRHLEARIDSVAGSERWIRPVRRR
jgi:hypothetical protein